MFFTEFSDKKIMTLKGLEPATSHLLGTGADPGGAPGARAPP